MSAVADIGGDLRARCLADPDFFSTSILGRKRWWRQSEMRKAIWDHRRVHVQSANSVGKTFDFGSIICEWLLLNPMGRVICTGPTYEQVRDGLWVEVRKAFDAAAARGFPLGGEMGAGKWRIANGWDATIVSVTNISAIQGRRGRKCLIVADEAQGIEDGDLWDAIESLMTATGSRMLEGGNPLRASGRFFDHAHDPEWHCITIDGLEHPNVVEGREIFPGAITREWVEEKKRSWGEDDPRYQARVRGNFPDRDDYSLVSLRMAREVEDLDPSTLAQDGIHLGVDIARFGGDSNVAAVVVDRKLTSVESWRGEDLMETVGRIQHIMSKHEVPAKNVHVDVCGMGAGVVDRLRELGLRVDAVDFGAGPQEDWRGVVGRDAKFGKRRSELYWVTRQLILEKQLHIPAEFRSIVADLTAPTYSWNSAGQIQIEAKEKIKARIGRSPDHGDALVLALSRTGSAGPRVRYV